MFPTRSIENKIIRLFSENRPFSEHLTKWEDPALPDKYDQNFFEYSAQPSEEEFRAALAYQRSRGASFLKLEGDEPLQNAFGLDESVTLTMVLTGDFNRWQGNPLATFRRPELGELERLEQKHFGPIYGEDFTIRNIRRQYNHLDYIGAYLDGALAGACWCFAADGYACIDGLVVDEGFRRQGVATALLKHLAARAARAGNRVFLHADADDTPREMYEKLGFSVADRLYEYLRTDLAPTGPGPGQSCRIGAERLYRKLGFLPTGRRRRTGGAWEEVELARCGTSL